MATQAARAKTSWEPVFMACCLICECVVCVRVCASVAYGPAAVPWCGRCGAGTVGDWASGGAMLWMSSAEEVREWAWGGPAYIRFGKAWT